MILSAKYCYLKYICSDLELWSPQWCFIKDAWQKCHIFGSFAFFLSVCDDQIFRRSTKKWNQQWHWYHILDCFICWIVTTSIWRRNERFLLSFLYGKSYAIDQCNCHSGIPVDILANFNRTVEQYDKFKAGWLVKMITCKNVFLLK